MRGGHSRIILYTPRLTVYLAGTIGGSDMGRGLPEVFRGMRETHLRTWLRPGMSVKRWAALLLAGVLLACLSVSMGIAWVYRTNDLPDLLTRLIQLGTLQAVPHPARGILLFVVGLTMLGYAIWRMAQSILAPFIDRSRTGASVAQIVAEHRFGPVSPDLNVVVIGGGTGLATALRGLKHANVGITAIVTVADDGGSTGRLRTDFEMPAPGDIRNCIVALSDAESTVGKLFNYRFEGESATLAGHSFGNLFIAALTQVTGNFEQAVIESGRVLATRGRVLPSTLEDVHLTARLVDGTIVSGESAIGHSPCPIAGIALQPARPKGYEPAISAILGADLIVLGPGSLYTSVLPNLLVAGVREAIDLSRARTVYVCNVATQHGETDAFGVEDHVRAIVSYLGEGVLDYVVANDHRPEFIAQVDEPQRPVAVIPGMDRTTAGVIVIRRDLVDPENGLWHDSDKLAQALLEVAGMPVRSHRPRQEHKVLATA